MTQKGSRRVKTLHLRMRIAELLLKGCSERQIAAVVGKSHSTVHHHSEALQKEWQAEMSANRDRWLAEQLARLAAVESEAWEAWDRSKAGRQTSQVKGKGLALMQGGHGRRATMVSPVVEIERSERFTTQTGDPEYLVRIQACIAERNKMLGLYHPDSEPFLVQREPDTGKYERARRAVADALGEGG
jgi:Helix-turn-helix domain